MAKEFELDISAFETALKQLSKQMGEGAQNGLSRVKDDWVEEAKHVAPEDTGLQGLKQAQTNTRTPQRTRLQ